MSADGASLEFRGAAPDDLFRRAALALSARTVDPASAQPGGLRDRLRVQAADPGALFAAWVEEVARQFSANHVVIAELDVRRLSLEGGRCVVEAEIGGELLDPLRHAVLRPAACLKGAGLEGSEGAWRAWVAFA